jgi:prepilin-type N-terminal cleavage/methylation domain-containing protein
MHQKGFTLVELIIAFSIISLLSIAGIASFVSFAQRQSLGNAISDLRTLLTVARTETIAQVNGNSLNACTSGEQFSGYVVVVCCRVGVNDSPTYCPTIGCTSGTTDYEMYEACTNSTSGSTRYGFIQSKTLPKGIILSSNTTARTYAFSPISGTVSFGGAPGTSGKVVMYLQGYPSITQTAEVYSVGTIQ